MAEKKSNGQLIVGALLKGKPLKSREISRMISKEAGKEIKIQDVASMLSKITDANRCDLGFFIKKVKEKNNFIYTIVPEARKLSERQAFDLTLKIGKDRYTLDEALLDFPRMKAYVDENILAKRVRKKPGRKKGTKLKTTRGKARSPRVPGRKVGRPPGSGKKRGVGRPPSVKKATRTPRTAAAAPVAPPVEKTVVATAVEKEVKTMETAAGKFIETVAEKLGTNITITIGIKIEK